jgi:hypothetical protein
MRVLYEEVISRSQPKKAAESGAGGAAGESSQFLPECCDKPEIVITNSSRLKIMEKAYAPSGAQKNQ